MIRPTQFFMPQSFLTRFLPVRACLPVWILVVTMFTATTFTASAAEIQPVKYVFLFIGDGMSFPQQQMAEQFVQKTENRGLLLNAMPYRATTSTYSANTFITESGAAATAIATGVRTNNNMISVAPNGDHLETIAEVAQQSGRKVGIISSVTINHATPAAFYAHNVSRGNMYEIGLDLIASGFDYFGGGGIDRHNDTGASAYRGDIYDLAREAGYTVARTEAEIRALRPGVGKVLAFGNAGALDYAMDSGGEGVRLPCFTRQAIELLDNPNGFFIMVEGGKIDWAGHNNDGAAVLFDMIEFDNAIAVAFEFAEKHPNDVLIVITGDHETGALTLRNAGSSQLHVELLTYQRASRDVLASLTRRFIRDNGEELTFEQTKPFITEMSGLIFSETQQPRAGNLVLTASEVRELETTFATSKAAVLANQNEGRDVFARTMVRILNNKAGLHWGHGDHSALPTQTSAWGNQAAQVIHGMRHLTCIGERLKPTVKPLPVYSTLP